MNYGVPFDPEYLVMIKQFVKDKVRDASSDGVVLGVSGGLDSAVVLKIAAEIYPKEQVTGIYLPESTTPQQDSRDIKVIEAECKLKLMEIPIDPILGSYLENGQISDPDPTALGNLKARIRMNILYLIANKNNFLVLGTSNKSELLLGYFTKFGDGGADISPLGDLYKTQIRQLARVLKIPEELISKPPTAGLVKGQTDEDELEMDYETADRILYGLERNISIPKLSSALKLPEKKINEIKIRMESNRHKRKFPKIPKIGIKTIGVDLYE